QFTPSATGNRNTKLTVTPARPGATPVRTDVVGGVGVPPDGFTATPNPLPFGQHPALTTSPGTLTIGNQGRIPFTITAVALPAGSGLFPGDYTITGNTCQNRQLAR